MSENQIRDSINCKNCGSLTSGNFCNNCGQRVLVHKETFGQLAHEFLSDFTHFDSKLIKCLFPLLLKPARLTKKYIDGQRISQFHPIRLYFFTSFVYFLVAFSGKGTHKNFANNNDKVAKDSIVNLINHQLKDSLIGNCITSKNDSLINRKRNGSPIIKDEYNGYNVNLNGADWLDSLIENDVTVLQYDSAQNKLKADKQDGFFRKYAIHKILLLAEESRKDGNELISKINEAVTHNIPKMLFFMLPIFALLLKLLYIRRKEIYYFDHAVLSLHYFSFIFVLLTLVFIPDKYTSVDLKFLAAIYALVYLYFAMKYLYHQSYAKTFLKFTMLIFMFCITLVFAFLITFMVSAVFAV